MADDTADFPPPAAQISPLPPIGEPFGAAAKRAADARLAALLAGPLPAVDLERLARLASFEHEQLAKHLGALAELLEAPALQTLIGVGSVMLERQCANDPAPRDEAGGADLKMVKPATAGKPGERIPANEHGPSERSHAGGEA